jgi:uncharacterized membrane protein YvlD (DUF360 family)
MNSSFLRRWAIGSSAAGIVFLVGHGVALDSLYVACMIVLLLGLINAVLPYLISMMTFMRNMLTLGLATLIMNALALHILQTAGLGIHFASFDAMMLVAIMISTISWFATMTMDAPLQTKP